MMKIGVIADDLTGANATGVRLTKTGFPASTIVYDREIIADAGVEAVCIDTDSRYAPDEVIDRRLNRAMDELERWGAGILCKRIDSTVRGKIGYEIDTMLNRLGEKTIGIVVASFPSSGRITSGGYLLVDGVPVQETDVAKDPVMPITQSYVPGLIQQQSENAVGHVGLETVLAGKQKIVSAIKEQVDKGTRILVFDAVTDEEIEAIAEAMAEITDRRLIPIDPGPLTAAYARSAHHRLVDSKKIVVTIGSVTTHTGRQINYLIDKTNTSPVFVDAAKLATFSESWETEIERATAEALERIDQETVLLITTYSTNPKILELRTLALEEGVSQDALAKRISDGLAKITRVVIEKRRNDIQGCFSSGGDVTASLCAISRAGGIRLEDEVLPLAAYGSFIGGHLDGLPVVTKGGMIGDKKAIYTSVKYLMTKNTKRSVQL